MNVAQFISTASPEVRTLKDTTLPFRVVVRLDESGANLSIFFRDLEHARQVLNSALAQVEGHRYAMTSAMQTEIEAAQ